MDFNFAKKKTLKKSTCETGQPNRRIWQQFCALLNSSALKMPSRDQVLSHSILEPAPIVGHKSKTVESFWFLRLFLSLKINRSEKANFFDINKWLRINWKFLKILWPSYDIGTLCEPSFAKLPLLRLYSMIGFRFCLSQQAIQKVYSPIDLWSKKEWERKKY